MDYASTHQRTIQQAFEKYDQDNPRIYELFKKFAFEIIKRKRPGKKTSAKLIINRIRWEVYIETVSDDGYRINDAWSALYARKFRKEFPEYADIFNYRRLRAL